MSTYTKPRMLVLEGQYMDGVHHVRLPPRDSRITITITQPPGTTSIDSLITRPISGNTYTNGEYAND